MDLAKPGAGKPQMEVIPAGSLLAVTTGDYSDYSVSGVFRAKATVDPEMLRHEWLADHPEQAGRYHFKEDAFLAWVAKRGIIEPVECMEWHLGDYSCVDEMFVSNLTTVAAS